VGIPATLRYDTTDPFAVTLTMQAGGRRVAWTFARGLLDGGVERPTGAGDVRVEPVWHDGRPVLAVALSSPSGRARLELPRGRVRAFLSHAYAKVPAGAEAALVDWDAELRGLLGAGNR
jgi:hypothetical protein